MSNSHLATRSLPYRMLEILPGLLVWITLIGAIVLSKFQPLWVALFIIVFDIFWVLKAINTSLHLVSSFRKLKHYARIDWLKRIELFSRDIQQYKQSLRRELLASTDSKLRDELQDELQKLDNLDYNHRILDFREVYHLVILPTYGESLEVLEHSLRSVHEADYPKDRIIFVLAIEERDLITASGHAAILRERYQKEFFQFLVTVHPDGLSGEIKAKGANLTFAARQALILVRDLGIGVEQVLVSAFDSDTVVSRNYFAYLTYAFLTAEHPYLTSFQPMPVYNNNIWDAPAITRVVAVANSFWQMVEASRPDRLVSFSSHALTLKALVEVDFWPVDVVSDDSQIFWRCWLHYHGKYRTQPLFTTVSLDAMLDKTYWQTLLGQYKQKRRWAWGVENFPYLVTNAFRDRMIPIWKKLLYAERMLEGFYFWATASIMIAVLGWLPLFLGASRFGDAVFALNLPVLTRTIMQVATLFLIFSVYINMVLLPKRPEQYSKWRTVNMILQWVFVPIVSTIFGSLPAIDALTRLMLGKYMGFWVTPKARKNKIEQPAMIFQTDHVEKS